MLWFVLQAVAVSLSGVISPGPMTAATLAAAVRPSRGRAGSPHAGALVAVGHAVVEMPLIALIILVTGFSGVLESPPARIAIGLAGGAFLVWMGAQMLAGLRRPLDMHARASRARHPVVIGIVLSAGNPYFLLWWVSVGLALAMKVYQRGALALALFAVIHWVCDLIWLEALSVAASKGSRLLGERVHKAALGVCAAAIVVFGCLFLYDAGAGLLKSVRGG